MHKSLYHYNKINAYQFITFRTNDSLDDFLLKLNEKTFDTESKRQYEVDQYLDNSQKGRHLNGIVINIILQHLKNMEPDYFKLIAVSIMPNHVHLLIIQHQNISKIMHRIKGGLASLINKKLNKKGSFWSRNYFDKSIRDQNHLEITYNYIKNNAIKANLSDATQRFYGIYE